MLQTSCVFVYFDLDSLYFDLDLCKANLKKVYMKSHRNSYVVWSLISLCFYSAATAAAVFPSEAKAPSKPAASLFDDDDEADSSMFPSATVKPKTPADQTKTTNKVSTSTSTVSILS